MMNVQQISAQLARMPDQALQKYAMMHKDDPYIMALAVSESRRRKEMRAAAAAPQGMQEQPKVADQALAEMAPMGVAALPTGDMDFAGGGIVAFADGGDVEHYQVGGSTKYETPFDRMNRENREREERERQERLARIAAEGGNTSSYGEQMGSVGRFLDQFVPDPANVMKYLVSAPGGPGLLTSSAPAAAAPTPYDPNTATRAADYRSQGAPGTGTAPAGGGLGATPEAAALRRAPGAGAPSVQGAQDLAGQFYDAKAVRAAQDKFIEDEKASIEAARKRREEGKVPGTAYSKYEEMLQKEEAGAAKEKDDAAAVAILNLGLGLMKGTSPHAFENLGNAGTAALAEYSSAIKDMKKAARERQKAFADIEQARRAEARDDLKSAREFEDKAETRMSNARKYGVDGLAAVTGKEADIAAKIYDRQVAEAGQTARAQVGRETLTPAQMAGLADKAMDNVQNQLKTDLQMQMQVRKNPGLMDQLVKRETDRLLGVATGRTMAAAPGAPSPGGTMSGWGRASVVNP